MSTPRHVPVLLERCVELLAPSLLQDGAVLVDATLGLGGHSEAFLQRFPGLRLLGLDRDPAALRLAAERLAPFGDRVLLVHSVYDEIADIAARLGLAPVAAVLFDLGVSSMQLDEAERGFAYAQDAPLDMRMNPDDELTAAAVVNTYSVAELARVLREYGEERFAQRIAARIVAARARQPLTTTAPLAELVREAVPAATRRTGGHPAKRTFQALRIEVNRELQALEAAIPAALSVLSVGGRIAVMSYQSLEDRIVKRALAEGARTRAPEGLPVVPDDAQPWLRLLTRGAETPTDIEISDNPRAASARLRAA
ncbi:MAG: 16S rRNA (cytosine(1402)-N(4))-methyltransferase RsmH, partial [Actinomycetes bacterium]